MKFLAVVGILLFINMTEGYTFLRPRGPAYHQCLERSLNGSTYKYDTDHFSRTIYFNFLEEFFTQRPEFVLVTHERRDWSLGKMMHFITISYATKATYGLHFCRRQLDPIMAPLKYRCKMYGYGRTAETFFRECEDDVDLPYLPKFQYYRPEVYLQCPWYRLTSEKARRTVVHALNKMTGYTLVHVAGQYTKDFIVPREWYRMDIIQSDSEMEAKANRTGITCGCVPCDNPQVEWAPTKAQNGFTITRVTFRVAPTERDCDWKLGCDCRADRWGETVLCVAIGRISAENHYFNSFVVECEGRRTDPITPVVGTDWKNKEHFLHQTLKSDIGARLILTSKKMAFYTTCWTVGGWVDWYKFAMTANIIFNDESDLRKNEQGNPLVCNMTMTQRDTNGHLFERIHIDCGYVYQEEIVKRFNLFYDTRMNGGKNSASTLWGWKIQHFMVRAPDVNFPQPSARERYAKFYQLPLGGTIH